MPRGVYKRTPEIRAKTSESIRAKWHDPEWLMRVVSRRISEIEREKAQAELKATASEQTEVEA